MSWSSLPLIEMDEVNVRKQSDERRNNSRLQSRDTSGCLEKDIGKQLSALREQSRTSRDNDNDKPTVDEFGRDIRRKATNKSDQEEEKLSQERESSRRRERSRSPRRWRDDDDRGRDRNRSRDLGRDEPRRRARDGYQSDGSNDSWEGGRAGERYRDWPRGRESDRYRERRDYRDRDDREWRRDRWEDRDDDRRRDYRDRYRHDDERYWSENRSRDRYDDRDYHHDYHQEPSEIVMLKGLPTSVEDTQIHEILANAKLPYKDVRVVKTREGYSRGFAFVEFLDMETAKKWIEECKGKLIIEDFSVIMDFSRSKMTIEPHRDWVCSKCGTQNFSSKRRNTCFTCNAPKDENDETKELGSTPCKGTVDNKTELQ